MSEVEWRGRTVPVKIDKVRIFLLGLADNEAAIVQVRRGPVVLTSVKSGVKGLRLWGRFTVTVMGKGVKEAAHRRGSRWSSRGTAVRLLESDLLSPPPCPQGHPSFLGRSQEPG
jgi:hypothetical protein